MIWGFIKRLFFKKEEQSVNLYELVERATDDGGFRQGIRILHPKYKGVVVEVAPTVSVKETDDGLKVSFDYDVVTNAKNLTIDRNELTQIVGDCIVDIIQKDYAQF